MNCNMKPSERIKEILRTPDKNGFYTSETGAILAYLDEPHEQQKPCEHTEKIAWKKYMVCKKCGGVYNS